MKTTIIKKAFVAIVITVSSVLSVNAQDFFFDKKYMNEQIISKTKYELKASGLYEKTTLTEYTYNEKDQLEKEETFKWDVRKSVWVPAFCVNHIYNIVDNTYLIELITWNKKENKYNEVSESAIYWMNEYGNVVYWDFYKNSKNSFEATSMLNSKHINYLCM